jgi:hypothetical protein
MHQTDAFAFNNPHCPYFTRVSANTPVTSFDKWQ